MLLLIEGCDAAGKTTLKNELVSNYGFIESVPKSLPTDKTDLTMCAENAYAINLCIENDEDVVMDRSWLSEAIYSPLLRKMDGRFSVAQTRMLERMAYTAGVVIVLCDPGWNTVRDNWYHRGDEHITTELMLRTLYQRYQTLHHDTQIPVVTYNYMRNSMVSELMNRVRKVANKAPTLKGLFGSQENSNLLVVCRPPNRVGDVPLISWRHDSMPAKITRAFSRAKLDESELTWTYATGHELRNIVVSGKFGNVAYIGPDLTLEVESALNGLDVDTWFLPLPGWETSYKSFLPPELIA
jgi:thymidylate kinase